MSALLNTIIAHGDTIIVAIVAIALGWDRYKLGKKNNTKESDDLRKEIAADYKERNAQLEQTLKEFENKLNNTNIEVAKLTATISEKDKHIDSLTKILQDKNPETLQLLKEISISNIEIKKFMEMMHLESRSERKHQTDILESQVRRERNIDVSSKDGSGDVMRTSPKGSK